LASDLIFTFIIRATCVRKHRHSLIDQWSSTQDGDFNSLCILLLCIAIREKNVGRRGGDFDNAMFLVTCIYSQLYSHREFVYFIGHNEK
jgi:hypothetical protein